uniref:MFS transporter n=1 Tax=Arthrobacter sp. TaxID=1667 RepID=UPI000EB6EAA2|nr:MFS transporter [Arthrobacter sp.]AXV46634.1 MFS transporter [Arthrobacter sp.]
MGTTLRQQMDSGTMSRYQWGTVALCLLLNIVDGFDILVVAYTSTSLTNEWGLSGSELGLLLSAGLFGMAAGTMFIAPLADKIGRRPLVLFCLALAAVGMFASALAPSPEILGILRVLTGLGMGGIIVSANVIASEFASKRWRGLAVSLNTTGYAFGAVVGGLTAVWLQSQFSWRGVFVFGGAMTLAAFLVLLLRMPESVDFLYLSKSPQALSKVNELARKMNKQQVTDLARPETASVKKASAVSTLLSPKYRRSTIIICVGFFLNMSGYYFVQSWTPRLLVQSGLSEAQGNLGGTVLNIGGMIGSIAIGVLLARFALKKVLVSYFAITGVLMCVFALVPSALTAAFIIALLIGVFANGCMAGLYTLVTGAYEPAVRATAVGWGITVGRMGAILAPIVAGGLLDLSWDTAGLYLLMSLPFFIAGATVAMIKIIKSNTGTTQKDDVVTNA